MNTKPQSIAVTLLLNRLREEKSWQSTWTHDVAGKKDGLKYAKAKLAERNASVAELEKALKKLGYKAPKTPTSLPKVADL